MNGPWLNTIIHSGPYLYSIIYSGPWLNTIIHSGLYLYSIIYSGPWLNTIIYSGPWLNTIIYSGLYLYSIIYSGPWLNVKLNKVGWCKFKNVLQKNRKLIRSSIIYVINKLRVVHVTKRGLYSWVWPHLLVMLEWKICTNASRCSSPAKRPWWTVLTWTSSPRAE